MRGRILDQSLSVGPAEIRVPRREAGARLATGVARDLVLVATPELSSSWIVNPHWLFNELNRVQYIIIDAADYARTRNNALFKATTLYDDIVFYRLENLIARRRILVRNYDVILTPGVRLMLFKQAEELTDKLINADPELPERIAVRGTIDWVDYGIEAKTHLMLDDPVYANVVRLNQDERARAKRGKQFITFDPRLLLRRYVTKLLAGDAVMTSLSCELNIAEKCALLEIPEYKSVANLLDEENAFGSSRHDGLFLVEFASDNRLADWQEDFQRLGYRQPFEGSHFDLIREDVDLLCASSDHLYFNCFEDYCASVAFWRDTLLVKIGKYLMIRGLVTPFFSWLSGLPAWALPWQKWIAAKFLWGDFLDNISDGVIREAPPPVQVALKATVGQITEIPRVRLWELYALTCKVRKSSELAPRRGIEENPLYSEEELRRRHTQEGWINEPTRYEIDWS